MANLTEHVMINKWDDDINNAIVHVGGDTYGSEGLPDYANIIKSQLISNDAIDKGIYQDFLYVDPETKETSTYPWEGEPTNSANAAQSSVIAESIKQIYEAMANTERFNVLLVDEIPKSEINLSAVYLVRTTQCENPEDPECQPTPIENTYHGCYFVKSGKNVRRIDIPNFEVNLDELFFLTRAEYDANLSQYVNEIEEMLKKKFGRYWTDDGFALDETIDTIIEELKTDLKNETFKIIQEFQERVDAALAEVDDKINDVETELNAKFDSLETNIYSKVDEVEAGLNEKFNQLETEISEDIVELRQDVEERVKKSDLISLNNEINELQ